ncbi:monoheme cytochrome C [Flagellimonas nanhaiensis]|uniref:Monoheme cytochrome C n=1 Tax=Flagellimonas nanhaiensis TaxID=2292706 RepID=A0A371JRC6_9FLAO|nr:monoheme cytochrome C [Allomuricauda nanhaiensis]RDY60072.1 monoheme cytochrome C [Allomuricauda nanhaiensis]
MENTFRDQIKLLSRMLFTFFFLFLILIGGLFYLIDNPETFESSKTDSLQDVTEADDKVENTIDLANGFIDDEGMEATIQNCTGCHSAQLVTQNRMSREGWKATIKWMQETQNLWDLGANEELILTYLSKNYAPTKKGRRQNLENIEWYELE